MKLASSWIDWKLGARMLVKYPGLSVIGGLTLAAAIGLGAGWFEVTQQLLKPRLPLPDGDRIVRIDSWDAAASTVEPRVMFDLRQWREQLTSVTDVGAFRTLERNLITADGSAHPEAVAEISASAFPMTRVRPLLGRTLIEADAEPGAADVVVIGYDVWQSRFDGSGSVIGRTVRLGQTPATIVGVMPDGFSFPINHQLWVPLRVASAAPREGPAFRVFGRLADGATLATAQAELGTIGQRTASAHPTTHAQLAPRVLPYAAAPPGSGDVLLVRLSNIVTWLILAAACANVATLMFARTATREAEIVVRNALGASRARVMMQLLVEAFVLCAVAAAVGLAAASFALDYAVDLMSARAVRPPFWWQFSIGPTTVAYTAILALGGAVLVGLLPALKATGPRVQSALTKMAGGSSTSMQFGGVWSVMIVLQVATAALCLPLGAGAAFSTLAEHRSRPAFPTHEYLTFRPELDRDATLIPSTGEIGEAEYRERLISVYDELERRLESESAVLAVTFADGLPGMSQPLRQVEASAATSQLSSSMRASRVTASERRVSTSASSMRSACRSWPAARCTPATSTPRV